MNRKHLTWLAVPPLTLAVLGGSIATAAWLNSGSGTATIGTVTVNPDLMSGSGSGLAPGTSVPVVVTVTNHNAYAEHLISITGGTSSNGDVTLAGGTYSGVTIAANGTVNETLQATMVSSPSGSPGDVYSIAMTASLGS